MVQCSLFDCVKVGIISENMMKHIHLQTKIPISMAGKRLDQALAELLPDYSRACLQQWIKAQWVTVDGAKLLPRSKVKGDEVVQIEAEIEQVVSWAAEALVLDIVFEDDSVLVINKPAGMVAHPAAGNWQGTLVNALLHHHAPLSTLPRAGLVHRLDKDTSGLLVVAKTLTAHKSLVEQLQARTVKRDYVALVQGYVTAGGMVQAPIGRHARQRKLMAVVATGKPAVTHYRVLQRFAAHTLLKLSLETGRTHQIRVHMAHLGYPIVGDRQYGGRLRLPKGMSTELQSALLGFKRQALHAKALALRHPVTGEQVQWEVPIAEDIQALLVQLAQS
jgi:23S rRNA pseudouridine1911/1915/1917 synthase